MFFFKKKKVTLDWINRSVITGLLQQAEFLIKRILILLAIYISEYEMPLIFYYYSCY